MNRKTKSLALLSLVALAASGAATAQDNIVKFGVTRYTTNSETTGIVGIGIPPGADAETGDATTVIFVYERTLTPNIGIELVLGVPPRIKAKATGSVAFLGDDILTAKNVAPTVIVNYYFGQPSDTWRPYVGAGVNYTRFESIRSTLPTSSIEMSDSVGLALQVGLSYAAAPNWGLFGSVARVDVKTDLVAVTGTVLSTTIDFKPVTFSGGLWYKF